MKKGDITLTQMAVLDAVARNGAIGAAAREIGLSQPTVSNHVSQIEARLATRLFDRNGNRFIANPRLVDMLPKIRAALALTEEIETRLRGYGHLDAGYIRLGYSTHQFVMSMIGRFIADHPGVKVEARSAVSYDLLDMLRRGEIEAAFVTLSEPDPAFESLIVRREETVLMANPASEIARRGTIEWHELEGLPLILREPASGTRRAFQAMAASRSVRTTQGLDLGSWESIRSAVIQSLGYGVALEGEIEPGDRRIAIVRVGPPSLEIGHYLVCLPEMRTTAHVSALFDIATMISRGNRDS